MYYLTGKMELLGSSLKEYSNSNNVTQEVFCLRTSLATLARHERILKMQLKKHSSGVEDPSTNTFLHILKKGICKQARLKRKITIIHGRNENRLTKSISSIIKIVNSFTKNMKQAKLQNQGGVLRSQGNIIIIQTTIDLLLMYTYCEIRFLSTYIF